MARYRHSLPQLSDKLFLTDGGLETTLVFHEKMDLPHFAAFDLMTKVEGRETLRSYFRPLSRDREAGRRPASSSRRRPGARAATGPKNSAIRPPSSPT